VIDLDAHIPVLAREAFEALAVQADGLYIDATFGRGGHTALILGALGPEGRVLAFDRDPAAIEAGHRRFPDEVRLALVGAPFADIAARVPELLPGRPVRGILFDLGVSSPQLDDPTRGFSFRADGPLDMRMDPTSGEPVSAWLARAGEPEIREVIAKLGEERFARRIAATSWQRARVNHSTARSQLADLVARAVRTREPGKNPATRTFQALRMHINDELGQLRRALAARSSCSPSAGASRDQLPLARGSPGQAVHPGALDVDPCIAGLPMIPESAQPRLARIGSQDPRRRRRARAQSARALRACCASHRRCALKVEVR
jgi:16S rRNA (cytosine1402-N4)-methyltransferase